MSVTALTAPRGAVQIIFCSRTHSQLSQFVREAKRTTFGADLRIVALGSRKSLCINEDVRGLGSVDAMNEACLQMKDKKRSVTVAASAGAGSTKAGKKRPRKGGRADSCAWAGITSVLVDMW